LNKQSITLHTENIHTLNSRSSFAWSVVSGKAKKTGGSTHLYYN